MTGDNQKHHECNLWMQLDAVKHNVWWIEQIYYISNTYIFKMYKKKKSKKTQFIILEYKYKKIRVFITCINIW